MKGTRVTLRTVLSSLAEGDRVDDILRDFLTLTTADVRAVIAFAAASACGDNGCETQPPRLSRNLAVLIHAWVPEKGTVKMFWRTTARPP
ncbi:MAG: hypothetical protein JWM63_2644 [Gammaproteobacteria bacterium]|jgi:hypothetical protein|nr:hypothetical protein [Gammaproteobacteria bacterium]